uniref:Uncharacterized protein n=1 Tax=Meloidogyne hapla TaxID=6305 RepID=A0A1I8C3F8_MELHA
MGSTCSNGKTPEGDYCLKNDDDKNINQGDFSDTKNIFPKKRGSKRKRDEGCCCSNSSTGVAGGGTGGNLMKHVQLHPHCGGTSGRLQHRYIGLNHHHCHQNQRHQHLLKPYFYPNNNYQYQQPSQTNSARPAAENENNQNKIINPAFHQLFLFGGENLRISDNSIGNATLPFPTGNLGERNRAMEGLHRPPNNNGIPLHNQFRGMRLSTGLVSLAKTLPLAVGVTTSPILSSTVSSTSSTSTTNSQQSSPLSSQTPSPAENRPKFSNVRQALGCLPKRISLPENLQFQPQILLNLKQSIHVEKQLTSNPSDVCSSSPSSELVTVYEKPVLKASRLQQQYQHQQQQKRKAARMQLLRQQSLLAQKQISCQNVEGIQSQDSPSFSPPQLSNIKVDNLIEEINSKEISNSDVPPPLSPIEDNKMEEIMDTS